MPLRELGEAVSVLERLVEPRGGSFAFGSGDVRTGASVVEVALQAT